MTNILPQNQRVAFLYLDRSIEVLDEIKVLQSQMPDLSEVKLPIVMDQASPLFERAIEINIRTRELLDGVKDNYKMARALDPELR